MTSGYLGWVASLSRTFDVLMAEVALTPRGAATALLGSLSATGHEAPVEIYVGRLHAAAIPGEDPAIFNALYTVGEIKKWVS